MSLSQFYDYLSWLKANGGAAAFPMKGQAEAAYMQYLEKKELPPLPPAPDAPGRFSPRISNQETKTGVEDLKIFLPRISLP
jgi:hypothetical protein